MSKNRLQFFRGWGRGIKKKQERKPRVTRGRDGRNYYFNARGKRISRALFFRRKHKTARRAPRRQQRQIQPLSGWETRNRWESMLFHDYPGITLQDAPPQFLNHVFPTEETYYLSNAKRYPPKEDIYIVIGIWFVVLNTNDDEHYLWGRVKRLDISKREDELFLTAQELYEGVETSIQEKANYIEVVEWVGWAADAKGVFKRGKKRHGKQAARKSRDHQ